MIPVSRSTPEGEDDAFRNLTREELIREQLEISYLHGISAAMFSTMRLNKLVHLILTALTSGFDPIFDRAMLFLVNERSGIMQGMLGVTSQESAGIINLESDLEKMLTNRWDISEADMARQLNSEFSRKVRASRLEYDRPGNFAARALLEKRPVFVGNTAMAKHMDNIFPRQFGIKSCVFAPLMTKDQPIGIIVVDHSLTGKLITQWNLSFLHLFTSQAGIAVENSLLYSRLKETNRSLREAREQLVLSERLSTIGEMAASIAHEVKGPLVSIGGFARRLEKGLPSGSPEHDHAATILREAQRLEKLLTDILSFAKKTTICYSTCNIRNVIEESLEIIGQGLNDNDIKVVKKFPRKTISILGDCQQLKQVFINLFLNAQDAMKNGGELRVNVISSRVGSRDGVSVKIADTGGGIPINVLNNVFVSFFTTKDAGTGLGLPIANRIVTNHGGKIQINNKAGIGVEFNVILPLCP